jgi:hypothetical protein
MSFLTALLIINIQAAPVPRGPMDVFFWEGPSNAGHFLATFLVMWLSASFAPSLLLSVELGAILLCLVTLCQRCARVFI